MIKKLSSLIILSVFTAVVFLSCSSESGDIKRNNYVSVYFSDKSSRNVTVSGDNVSINALGKICLIITELSDVSDSYCSPDNFQECDCIHKSYSSDGKVRTFTFLSDAEKSAWERMGSYMSLSQGMWAIRLWGCSGVDGSENDAFMTGSIGYDGNTAKGIYLNPGVPVVIAIEKNKTSNAVYKLSINLISESVSAQGDSDSVRLIIYKGNSIIGTSLSDDGNSDENIIHERLGFTDYFTSVITLNDDLTQNSGQRLFRVVYEHFDEDAQNWYEIKQMCFVSYPCNKMVISISGNLNEGSFVTFTEGDDQGKGFLLDKYDLSIGKLNITDSTVKPLSKLRVTSDKSGEEIVPDEVVFSWYGDGRLVLTDRESGTGTFPEYTLPEYGLKHIDLIAEVRIGSIWYSVSENTDSVLSYTFVKPDVTVSDFTLLTADYFAVLKGDEDVTDDFSVAYKWYMSGREIQNGDFTGFLPFENKIVHLACLLNGVTYKEAVWSASCTWDGNILTVNGQWN